VVADLVAPAGDHTGPPTNVSEQSHPANEQPGTSAHAPAVLCKHGVVGSIPISSTKFPLVTGLWPVRIAPVVAGTQRV
jgi:hypothetical protein